MLKIRCPHCQQRIGVPETALGKRVKCANCSQVIDVPSHIGASQAEIAHPETPISPSQYDRQNNKQCSFCGEQIPSASIKCTSCGESLLEKSSRAIAQTRSPIKSNNINTKAFSVLGFFNFDVMWANSLLKFAFAASLVLFTVVVVLYIYDGFHFMKMAGYDETKDIPFGIRLLSAGLIWPLGVVILRLWFEPFILFFKIHETLNEIKERL
jgi:predicted Zn finger-like uncharacterized protein